MKKKNGREPISVKKNSFHVINGKEENSFCTFLLNIEDNKSYLGKFNQVVE